MIKLEELKHDYHNIEIPEELDFVVRKAIKDSKKEKNKIKTIRGASWVSVALLAVVISVNTSPTVANAMSEVPIVGNLIKIVTFREYKFNEKTYNANIKSPSIEGMKNKDTQKSLNEKYIEENKKLYEEFNKEVKDLETAGGGHLGVDSGYVVKTDNERILSIGRYVVNTVGSSSTTYKYDTIDKNNEILITLPSLFKDDSYIDIISENIKDQMIQQMKDDPNKYYWVKEKDIDPFEKIDKNQDFYINDNNKIVISFNKYMVAPGYMGVVEFEITTDVISNILVSDEYIK